MFCNFFGIFCKKKKFSGDICQTPPFSVPMNTPLLKQLIFQNPNTSCFNGVHFWGASSSKVQITHFLNFTISKICLHDFPVSHWIYCPVADFQGFIRNFRIASLPTWTSFNLFIVLWLQPSSHKIIQEYYLKKSVFIDIRVNERTSYCTYQTFFFNTTTN